MKTAFASNKPQSRKILAALLTIVALTSVCLCSITSTGCSFTCGLIGSIGNQTYGEMDLTFQKIELQKDGTVQITFTCLAETMYSCAGANAKTTTNGVELSFVRASLGKDPKVDCPTSYVSKTSSSKTITVPSHGGAIFLRDGERLVKLFPTK